MSAYKTERDLILRAFGENLRELRPLGVSQEAVGETARLHRTEIGNLERGRSEPSLHTLLILRAAYGVSLDRLVSGVPVPNERKPSPYAKREPANRGSAKRAPVGRRPAKPARDQPAKATKATKPAKVKPAKVKPATGKPVRRKAG
jgi:transcriptional regulator with XRE-family HTH domain